MQYHAIMYGIDYSRIRCCSAENVGLFKTLKHFWYPETTIDSNKIQTYSHDFKCPWNHGPSPSWSKVRSVWFGTREEISLQRRQCRRRPRSHLAEVPEASPKGSQQEIGPARKVRAELGKLRYHCGGTMSYTLLHVYILSIYIYNYIVYI